MIILNKTIITLFVYAHLFVSTPLNVWIWKSERGLLLVRLFVIESIGYVRYYVRICDHISINDSTIITIKENFVKTILFAFLAYFPPVSSSIQHLRPERLELVLELEERRTFEHSNIQHCVLWFYLHFSRYLNRTVIQNIV